MPSTKTKPRHLRRQAKPSSEVTSDVLTLAEAAAYLRLSEDDVLRLIREQGLPARQAGSEWRFSRPAIHCWLGTGSQTLSNKAAWAALLERAWQEDLAWGELRDEIARERQRTEQR